MGALTGSNRIAESIDIKAEACARCHHTHFHRRCKECSGTGKTLSTAKLISMEQGEVTWAVCASCHGAGWHRVTSTWLQSEGYNVMMF